jgi:ActR/RegA family two-component response regulator
MRPGSIFLSIPDLRKITNALANRARDIMRAGALLLVEDDPAFSRVLERALDRREFDVRAVSTVDAALQLLQVTDRPFDFAILDLNVAGMSGSA